MSSVPETALPEAAARHRSHPPPAQVIAPSLAISHCPSGSLLPPLSPPYLPQTSLVFRPLGPSHEQCELRVYQAWCRAAAGIAPPHTHCGNRSRRCLAACSTLPRCLFPALCTPFFWGSGKRSTLRLGTLLPTAAVKWGAAAWEKLSAEDLERVAGWGGAGCRAFLASATTVNGGTIHAATLCRVQSSPRSFLSIGGLRLPPVEGCLFFWVRRVGAGTWIFLLACGHQDYVEAKKVTFNCRTLPPLREVPQGQTPSQQEESALNTGFLNQPHPESTSSHHFSGKSITFPVHAQIIHLCI